MNKFKPAIIKALLPQIILTQTKKHPTYGWQLLQHIRKKYHTLLSPSTLYPILNNLEKQGLLQSQWQFPLSKRKFQKPTRKPRKMYTLTQKGYRLLNQNMTVLALVNRMVEVQTK